MAASEKRSGFAYKVATGVVIAASGYWRLLLTALSWTCPWFRRLGKYASRSGGLQVWDFYLCVCPPS